MLKLSSYFALLAAIVLLVGCNKPAPAPNGNAANTPPTVTGGKPATATPTFTIAASEYPSWSTLFVADHLKLIDQKQGKQGPVEKKWGVDIVVKEADYDTCLTLFGNGTVDASCQTNMDSLAPSSGRKTVLIGPTSTSAGADACVVVGVADLDALKEKTTYGLEKSVSQFAWYVGLLDAGKNPKEYTYKNMDPAAAAQAMQTGQENVVAIQVWNPFVLQTLRTRSGSKVLFSSETKPEHIIDCIAVGEDVLHKPGGEDFACAVLDTFYQVNKALGPALGTLKQTSFSAADAQNLVTKLTGDQKDALVALGAKFSSLPAEDMAICTHQTVFYRSPEEGVELFKREEFQKKTTPFVTKFCLEYGIVEKEPTVSFGSYKDNKAQLIYDTQFMERVAKAE